MRSLIICTPGDKLKGDRAVNLTRGEARSETIIVKLVLKISGGEDLDSVNLVLCMNKWQAVMNTVNNRRGSSVDSQHCNSY